MQAKACPDIRVLARPIVKLCAAHGDVCGLDASQVGGHRIQRVPGKLVGNDRLERSQEAAVNLPHRRCSLVRVHLRLLNKHQAR